MLGGLIKIIKEPDESDMPVWYMPDEFGMRIGHSIEPNFRMVPMFYSAQNVAYKVVTRDYVDNTVLREHSDWRHILMHPWAPVDLSRANLHHVFQQDEFFIVSYLGR
ncbi:unnamed protein product [Toxocara canis]|uniref:START domain-containing protein n=1 Tax=Toxocara canis TaxID=6265 RepID=A0A183U6X3_TOXCA|nr:unnamed protein product [Toxocara canis]